MKYFLLIILLLVPLGTSAEESHVFTDQDLEKYKTSGNDYKNLEDRDFKKQVDKSCSIASLDLSRYSDDELEQFIYQNESLETEINEEGNLESQLKTKLLIKLLACRKPLLLEKRARMLTKADEHRKKAQEAKKVHDEMEKWLKDYRDSKAIKNR